jgi:hypothetical protein
MEHKTEYVIVNQSAVPADERTRAIIIEDLEFGQVNTPDKHQCARFTAVLLAMKATQTALPF